MYDRRGTPNIEWKCGFMSKLEYKECVAIIWHIIYVLLKFDG